MDDDFEKALAFFTPPPDSWVYSGQRKIEAAGQWIWETLQGDFNTGQTTGQVVTGTVISMIPFVDQLCDIRDLVANCKKINEDDSDTWAWVALCLTLIGCFPVLGSLCKGGFKVLFLYLRKSHLDQLNNPGQLYRALEGAIGLLNDFLNMPATRSALKYLKIYNPYRFLEEKLRGVIDSLDVFDLLSVFDELLSVTKKLLDKVTAWGPASLKQPVAALWNMLMAVRRNADRMLGKALAPVTDLLEKLANRLRVEGDNAYRAHVGSNAHLYGGERAAKEVEMFKREKPDWVDVGVSELKYEPLRNLSSVQFDQITKGWPDLRKNSSNDVLKGKFNTFDSTMTATEIPPGEVIYRIIDPNSSDNSICWMHKAEFEKLASKSDWRKNFAVWKSWNENGEYVVYTVPPGQPLKVWEGRAATQINENAKEYSLEGGAVQIVLNPSQLKKEFTGERRKTGWGYGDVASDPVSPYLGLPKLENKNNWYEPKGKE